MSKKRSSGKLGGWTAQQCNFLFGQFFGDCKRRALALHWEIELQPFLGPSPRSNSLNSNLPIFSPPFTISHFQHSRCWVADHVGSAKHVNADVHAHVTCDDTGCHLDQLIIFKSSSCYLGRHTYELRCTRKLFISLVGDPYKPSLATLTGWGSVPPKKSIPTLKLHHPQSVPGHCGWSCCSAMIPRAESTWKTRRCFDQHVQNALNQRAKSHLKTYRW